jgi:hypothetical protein
MNTYTSTDVDQQRGPTLRMCGLKTVYRSLAEAQRAADRIANPRKRGRGKKRKAAKPGPQMRPYSCPCRDHYPYPHFHLTKSGVSQ